MNPNSAPYFSIIIPTKNEEQQISECLKAISQQDTPLPYEVIIVDSSTQPGTRAQAAQYHAMVVDEPRPGKGIAVHTGGRHAAGEILCFSEADCRVTPHWLSAIHAGFQAQPGVVAVVGDYEFHDASWFYRTLCKIFLPLNIWGFYLLYRNHSLRGTNFAVRAKNYREAGEFSLSAKEFQDVELGLRLRKFGKIRYVRAMRITTSARRIQGRLLKFISEFIPPIYRLLVRKEIPDQATYDDIR